MPPQPLQRFVRLGVIVLVAILLIGAGVLVARQSALSREGTAKGVYPRYGHAPDFSWVSGKMELHVDSLCLAPECGCSLLRYEETGARLQLNGPGWPLTAGDIPLGSGVYLIVHGHLAGSNEAATKCPFATDARVYVVEQIEVNHNVPPDPVPTPTLPPPTATPTLILPPPMPTDPPNSPLPRPEQTVPVPVPTGKIP